MIYSSFNSLSSSFLSSLSSLNYDKILKLLLNETKDNKILSTTIITISSISLLYFINKLFGTNPIGRTIIILQTFFQQEKKRNIKVGDWIDNYNDLHKSENVEDRNSAYTTLVNSYYELATLFYEWGWGQSFHFAYQLKGESFKEAIARHEYYLAGRLGVKQGDKILDVGCGIGGPMRNIARFTRAHVTGVTLNEYQVQRGNELNKAAGLEGKALSVQADFLKLPFEPNSFDGVYAIEATCHAPRRQSVYGEIYRVLKPGQVCILFYYLSIYILYWYLYWYCYYDKGGLTLRVTNYHSRTFCNEIIFLTAI